MDSGSRKIAVIALIAVLVVAAGAVVLASGALNNTKAPTTLTDASGTSVTVNSTSERIVSCSPAITEMVYALGLGDKLVAVTQYDDYPAEAKDLVEAGKVVGGFSNPSFEAIVNYTPDLVLLEKGAPGHDDLASALRNAGYTVVMMYSQNSIEDVYKCIDLLGQATGTQSKASSVIAEMKAKISAIGTRVESDSTTPDVMFVVYAGAGFTDPYVAGSNTAIDQIVSMAGGKNAFPSVDGFDVPSSDLLYQNAATVDYIFITIMYSTVTPEDLLAALHSDSNALSTSPAVINNNVYFLTGQGESVINRQSVRMADGVQLVAEILHPSMFESKVPHSDTGVNLIGDEYEDYLTAGTSSHVASVSMAVAVSKD